MAILIQYRLQTEIQATLYGRHKVSYSILLGQTTSFTSWVMLMVSLIGTFCDAYIIGEKSLLPGALEAERYSPHVNLHP